MYIILCHQISRPAVEHNIKYIGGRRTVIWHKFGGDGIRYNNVVHNIRLRGHYTRCSVPFANTRPTNAHFMYPASDVSRRV